MNILQEFDTIAAIATPLGMGGVGIIRISGDKAFEIIEKIFTNSKFEPRKFNHGWIIDGDPKIWQKQKEQLNSDTQTESKTTCIAIDEVIVLPFFAPNSYTGENVVEIQCHGGINVVKNILNLVLANGARMAEKGEFTKRAFLNKRLDLSQAEAIADIIHSKTSDFAKVSVKNLSGVLKEKINEIRNEIFEVLSRITAGIDFPEDVAEPEYSYLIEKFESIITQINSVLANANTSNVLRQGISVAIVGKPNVGKSSLFNALLSLDRAIVTDIAGTTRDVLKETLDLGIPVTLVDTAGIRGISEEENKVEAIGIEYSKQSLAEADLVLFVYDSTQGIQEEDEKIYDLVKDKNHIVIANKCDLVAERESEKVYLSALTGEGVQELKQTLTKKVCDIEPDDLEFVTNKRQQTCLSRAKASIDQALLAANIQELQDLISIDVKSAILALDEITGELITDDILDNIFDHFCIGK
ncbi:MAG: tRNA uridine-5-carboxymethylaminomethyl(34) synthesis GTPase MnmE [Cyanobacteria bacterium SIG28]|nr:tRNA uridine-5-carboxymethylaminomethyl(34) synthesis GTPase MnmE [Cyanobacteria bacterium SIG28]